MVFSQLEKISGGKILSMTTDQPVSILLTDSRKAVINEGAVFFAISGRHHDGHQFIDYLLQLGIKQFVVERPIKSLEGKANFLLVPSAIRALQDISTFHRATLRVPVIGITGSNGKTIVKEWLYQLLSPNFKIAKNPASYNSQLGVPLSVWQMQAHHTLGIFEAGISTTGEMVNLQRVLDPTIGVFTNIGSAHSEGFADTGEKIREKLKLFTNADVVIYCKDHKDIDQAIENTGLRTLTWSMTGEASLTIRREQEEYRVDYGGQTFRLNLPFTDAASVENCFHCILVMLHLGVPVDKIDERISTLRAVPMRLELKDGINQCQIIDDTYNNDLAGLQVSLDFLAHQQQRKNKRVILSDIHESGLPDPVLIQNVATLLASTKVQHFVGIGPVLTSFRKDFPPEAQFFSSTEAFLRDFDFSKLHDEVILVKGARVFAFEKIVNHIQQKVHGTVMEIDLDALVHNLNYFKSHLQPSTRVMAMVKAFAYGSGSNEIANVLQYHKVDYLGVAYADEGVELRRNNINVPIMVMNPAAETFDTLLRHDLEPEVYNFRTLHALGDYLRGRPCSIHLKIDTGMRRLGFEEELIDGLITLLLERPNLQVASIFSHLAGSDEAEHDAFSQEQGTRFREMADRISQRLGYRPIYHLLNSSGILRLPDLQFDMVRLGIGLYGVAPSSEGTHDLKPVASLKTIISQIKHIAAGETIGYGRKGVADKDLTIATIAIGYADGFSRAFSNGVGKVLVNGIAAPVIGNVCMDMTMINITGISAREGDSVIIFDGNHTIEDLARSIHTIPYEILASTRERVKRIFVAESI